MKRLLALSAFALLLAACVDTTGLSAESAKPPRGNANAVIVLAEYADLECPACRTAHTALNAPLIEKYGKQVRFEYRHFPLRSIHRYTMDLAEGAECAADQGKFWEFVDLAFERQDQLKNGIVHEWAVELQLESALFDRCTASHIKKDAVMADYDGGVTLSVRGTPTYFVNGRQMPATMDDLTQAIETELKGAMMRL